MQGIGWYKLLEDGTCRKLHKKSFSQFAFIFQRKQGKGKEEKKRKKSAEKTTPKTRPIIHVN